MEDLSPLMARVAKRLEVGDCWVWTGAIDKRSGYGRIQEDGRTAYVHRSVYEELVGLIPVGMHVDHMCTNRACCNPDHLDIVPPSLNAARGARAKKSRCPKGHPYEGDNLREYVDKAGYQHRICRQCNIERCRRFNANRKAA